MPTVSWWSLVFMWIVHCAARGRTGPVAEIIEGRLGIDLPVPIARKPAQFIVVSAASIAAAAASWAIFERPINRINRIKYRSPYVAETVEPTTAVVVAPRK